MIFYGCNTSIGASSQAIADYYGVTLYANEQVTAFTANPSKYDRIDTFDDSCDIYLAQVVKSDNDIIRSFENYTQFIGREVVPHTVYKPQVTKE